jgi:hypothetical protein
VKWSVGLISTSRRVSAIAEGQDPIATDPSVEISWSDDGGLTWSNPILRKLGRQAMSQQLISLVSCTGRNVMDGAALAD